LLERRAINRTQTALYALRQGWATLDEPPA
jgi:hypothetical protein